MADAWMKRSGERQRFLEDIKKLILDEWLETHMSRVPEYLLHGQFVTYFSKQDGFLLDYPDHTHIAQSMKKLFREHIVPQVQAFARTSQEKNALLAELAEWVHQSVVRPYKHALTSQEIHEPEKVFDGKTATEPAD